MFKLFRAVVQRLIQPLIPLLVMFGYCTVGHAFGSHPDSTVCSAERPYQAICTHSLHNLEGWYGLCYSTREKAQQYADQHVNDQHNGNSRWTGIKTK